MQTQEAKNKHFIVHIEQNDETRNLRRWADLFYFVPSAEEAIKKAETDIIEDRWIPCPNLKITMTATLNEGELKC